ncbi:hypothetical protein SynMEDNS5_02620 [Synechococcus sp. MEDNS5]|nr:hypothetical protein SynMEDNS5_02620 [Synechococcus sp. MEDNS5]
MGRCCSDAEGAITGTHRVNITLMLETILAPECQERIQGGNQVV